MSGGNRGNPKLRVDVDVGSKGGSGVKVSGILPWGNDEDKGSKMPPSPNKSSLPCEVIGREV